MQKLEVESSFIKRVWKGIRRICFLALMFFLVFKYINTSLIPANEEKAAINAVAILRSE